MRSRHVVPCRLRLSLGLLAWLVPGTHAQAQQPDPSNLRPQLDLRLGHGSVVNTVALSPDERIVATGGADQTIKLWWVATGALWRTLEGHGGGVSSVAFSPDGALLASASVDKTIRLWRVRGGVPLRTLEGHQLPVRALAFSPDGKLLISHGDDGLKVWNPATGEFQRNLIPPVQPATGEHAVGTLCFSANGKTLASGRAVPPNDLVVQLCDVATGEIRRNITTTKSVFPALALSPDGKLLATDNSDPSVQLWDTATGALVKTLTGSRMGITALAFSPDGRTVAGGGGEGAFKFWVDRDDRIRLWDIKTGAVLRTLQRHSAEVSGLAFSADGKTLASASDDRTAIVWNVAAGQAQYQLGDNAIIPCAMVCGRGATDNPVPMLSMLTFGGRFRYWNLQTGALERILGPGLGYSMAASPDGNVLAVGDSNATVTLLDAHTGAKLRSWRVFEPQGGHAGVDREAFSPDGTTLVTASQDFMLRLWEVGSGKLLHTMARQSGLIMALTFSPDGTCIASGCDDNTIKLWDAHTGALLRTLSGHEYGVLTVTFSPDSKTLVSGGYDQTLRVWDAVSGEVRRTIGLGPHGPRSLLCTPDGRTLIVGGNTLDTSLTPWEVKGGWVGLVDPLTGAIKRELLGHKDDVRLLSIASAGRRLVSGSPDHTTKVWDLDTGRLLATLYALPEQQGSEGNDYLTVTPEGYYMGSTGADRYINFKIGNDSFPVESFQSIYYRPDLVQKALAGQALPPPQGGGLPVPPAVYFVSYPQEQIAGDSAAVTVQASDDTGIKDVLFFVNGARVGDKPTAVDASPAPADSRPLPADSRPLPADARPLPADARPLPADARSIPSTVSDLDPKALTADSRPLSADSRDIPLSHKILRRFKATIPIPRDVATIRVQTVAIDNDGLQSPREEIVLHRKDVVQVPGKLLGLCVGISLYQDPQLNLKYAEADATSLAQALNQQKGLYTAAQVTALTNEQATHSAITAALDKLIAQTTRNDTVMLLLSGHGWRKDERDFYFASYETDRKDVSNSALPWREVVERLTQLSQKSRRVIVFLDACHSGSAVTNEELVKAVLGANAGVMVFASSRGSEVSLELKDQEHGAFTEALLEAVRGQGAAATEKQVTTLNFLAYVSQRVKALTENRQHPQVPYLQDFDTDAALVARL